MAGRHFFRDHVCVVDPLCPSRDRWRERVPARTDEIAGGTADFSCAGTTKSINHCFCSARFRGWGFARRQRNAGDAREFSCRFRNTEAVVSLRGRAINPIARGLFSELPYLKSTTVEKVGQE